MRGIIQWIALGMMLCLSGMAAARVGVVNTGDLNLRATPEIRSGNILEKLDTGARVTILGQDSRWLHVRTESGAAGWVDMDFVDEATPGVVNTGDLNLRATPEINPGNVLGKLDTGARITIFGRQGRWLHIRTESGGTGWVDMDYINEQQTPIRTGEKPPAQPPAQPPPAAAGEPGRVNADLLNVRAAPDLSADNVKGQLVLGAAVTVLETRGEWLRVRGADGPEGWVAAVYIDRGSHSDPEALLRSAQDIFHNSYAIEKITFLDGSEEYKAYKPARVMEAYNIVDRLLRTPGFATRDTALLLRGKCLAVIGWYGSDFDPKFFKLNADAFRRNQAGGNYVYLGADFKSLIRDYPDSNLADDASFELANLPRTGDCRGHLDCYFERELNAFADFLKQYPDSPLVRRAIELINAASLDVLLLAEDADIAADNAGSFVFDRKAFTHLIERYHNMVKDHPSADRVYALHPIADAYLALGRKDHALRIYETISAQFPRYELIEHINQSLEKLK